MPGRLNARERGRPAASLSSGSHLLHHRPSAKDRHDAPEVIREHMEAHFGADMLTLLISTASPVGQVCVDINSPPLRLSKTLR